MLGFFRLSSCTYRPASRQFHFRRDHSIFLKLSDFATNDPRANCPASEDVLIVSSARNRSE